MATNKAFVSDEGTFKGIPLTTRRTPNDLENRRIPNENTSFKNEPLDTYFADERIHIPDRVRRTKHFICSVEINFLHFIAWFQFSHVVGFYRTRFLDVNCFDWSGKHWKWFEIGYNSQISTIVATIGVNHIEFCFATTFSTVKWLIWFYVTETGLTSNEFSWKSRPQFRSGDRFSFGWNVLPFVSTDSTFNIVDNDRDCDHRCWYARSYRNCCGTLFAIKQIVIHFIGFDSNLFELFIEIIIFSFEINQQHSIVGWNSNYNYWYIHIPMAGQIWTTKIGNVLCLSDHCDGYHIWIWGVRINHLHIEKAFFPSTFSIFLICFE